MDRKTTPLAVVPPPQRARTRPRARAGAIAKAAAAGDERSMLAAMRARLTKELDNPLTLTRDLAVLSRRIQELTADIKALDEEAAAKGGTGGTTHDNPDGPAADEPFDPAAL